ncbi:MAG TPA: stage II sporulation protein M [Bacteroidetes bacterium]|nr:stage II sporulation protein M [Bacteroidota bacterium]
MRETDFIRQNEAKWKELEQLLEGSHHAPDQLSELFVQVTDDLSYARTFYPNRSVRVYLNGLAQRIFFKIYKGKTSRRSRIVAFWLDELPLLIYQARYDLLFSLLLFVGAMAIGMLSCAADPEFLRTILGDGYVNMTNENIASGDPMAVYKEHGEFNMFLGITLNNILVALITFLLGVFYGIGTIGSLLYNGIMLGAFQYFFIDKGLFQESFLAVWLHGAFEISSIVIAGAAGITMGRGLVFPGTLPRMRSFQLSARRGMSLLVSTLPLFILAGFIESFMTRYTDAPDLLRAFFIFLCFGFVLFYFVVFPRLRVKKNAGELPGKKQLTPDYSRDIDFTIIKTTGEVFTDTFLFFRKHFRPFAWVAAAGAALYCLVAFGGAEVSPPELFSFGVWMFGTLSALPGLFINEMNPWLLPVSIVVFSIMAFVVFTLVERDAPDFEGEYHRPVNPLIVHGNNFLKTFMAVAGLLLLLLTNSWYTLPLLIFFGPVLLMWSQVMVSEGVGVFEGLSRTSGLISGNYGPMLGLFLSLMLCGVLFFFILDSGFLLFGNNLLFMLLDYLSMNFLLDAGQSRFFFAITLVFITFFILLLVFTLLAAGCGLLYFCNLEKNEANFLREKIRHIEVRREIRGLERE